MLENCVFQHYGIQKQHMRKEGERKGGRMERRKDDGSKVGWKEGRNDGVKLER